MRFNMVLLLLIIVSLSGCALFAGDYEGSRPVTTTVKLDDPFAPTAVPYARDMNSMQHDDGEVM